MSRIHIPGVGEFDREVVRSPWGDEGSILKTVSLETTPPRSKWIPLILTLVPSFATGVVVGIFMGIFIAI